jgi:hypothetical protein
MTPDDASLLVFSTAAYFGHKRIAKRRPGHTPISDGLLGVALASAGTIVMHPSEGPALLALVLLIPTSCLWAVAKVHGFHAWLIWILGAMCVATSWLIGWVNPEAYAWAVLASWAAMTTLAIGFVLDPVIHICGITRVSAVLLAASLLADLPGVFAWARTGSWRAESVLSVLSVAILAMLPTLWKLRICEQRSSESSSSGSGSQ